jgi:sulfatase modifying factor 1
MKSAALLTLLLPLSLSAAPPVISNVTASQRAGTKLVDIRYDVADPDSGSLTIQIELSANGGQTYELPVRSLTGAVGAGVAPGTSRLITWNAGADWNGNWSPNCKARLWAHDGSTPVPPPGMVFIPSGTFDMGSGPGVIGVPVTLTKSYFMDRTEVSAELWNEVRSWGLANGYAGIGSGSFRALGHPIHSITWYDCMAWSNARSEMNGLKPCYYTDATKTVVSKDGGVFSSDQVDWNANGFRLPVEAEWERAARGGLYRKTYPWGDDAALGRANYMNSQDPFELPAADPTAGTSPCAYFNGSQSPGGPDMTNGYGLYDCAGNVAEWCWPSGSPSQPEFPYYRNAWVDKDFYGQMFMLARGGSWWSGETAATVNSVISIRGGFSIPFAGSHESRDHGLRTMRGL